MAKISVDLSDEDFDEPPQQTTQIKKMAASLPSSHKAKKQSIKDAKRVQFSFTQVPEPIKKSFDKEAKRRKMTKKEYLYYCLRAGGLDIPEIEEIDGRRR